MRIDDERVGLLDADEDLAHRRRGEGRGPVGAVDVQPQAAFAAHRRDAGEVVDDTEVRGAGRGDDGEDVVRVRGLEGRAQRLPGHAEALVHLHRANVDIHHAGGRRNG